MNLLRLCETREYSPQQLEHWLNSIQKKKEGGFLLLLNKKGKVYWLCSEDLSTYLSGSRSLNLGTQQLKLPTPSKKCIHIGQSKGPLLPIKRYAQFEDRAQKTRIAPLDTLLPELSQKDGAFVYFHYRPLSNRKREKALKKVKAPYFEPERRLDQWESRTWFQAWWQPSLRKLILPWIRRLLPKIERRTLEEQTESSHEREDPKRAILDKLSRPLFELHIHSSAAFSSYFHSFNLPYLGTFELQNKPSSLILSSEELATLWSPPHMPQCATYLDTEPTLYLPPPPNNKGLAMGEDDRKRHLYVMGKTGMGKSTALLELFEQDLKRNGSIVIMDPHGDLIEEALGRTPTERSKDLILLDPSETNHPLALNPLEVGEGENPYLKTSALVEIFSVLAQGSWGPRLEYILRNALLLLSLAKNTTLLDLPRVLTHPPTLLHFLSGTRDTELLRFFHQEFLALDERTRHDHISPILNKVGPLLTLPTLRNIFGQPQGKFQFKKAFEQNRVVLINLSKGKLGEDASRILGMVFLSMIQSTLLERANVPPTQRSPVYLTLDEFQNFSTKTLLSMLAESRKYGLALSLTNQYLTQVPEDIQAAVLGNVGSLICFRSSYEDAELLAPSLGLLPEDLTRLPPFQAYAKLLNQNQIQALFRLELSRNVQTHTNSNLLKEKWSTIMNASLLRYGRRRSLVEAKVQERYNKVKRHA